MCASFDAYNITIENANIKGAGEIGALVGYMMSGTVENCSVYGEGAVQGSSSVGGLMGRSYGTVINCSSDIEVIGTSSSIGGLIGMGGGNIERCYSDSNVLGSTYVGGLIGSISLTTLNSRISESYATGDVKTTKTTPIPATIGGLIGYISNSSIKVNIENCFSLGSSQSYGLIGSLDMSSKAQVSVINCYSSMDIGKGIVGSGNFSIVNSYYDGSASKSTPLEANYYSRITPSMKRQSNYKDWDFTNIWAIGENVSYPYLKNVKKPLNINKNSIESAVAGGMGTESNPYLISTEEHLMNIDYELESNYKLIKDIDLNNMAFKSMGSSNVQFSGVLDGDGYTIKNLKTTGQTATGLFAFTKNATIKNLNIENLNIIKGIYAIDRSFNVIINPSTGGLIGSMNNGTVENCSVTGTITTDRSNNVGGIAGYSTDGSIINSSAHVNIISDGSSIGGIVGGVKNVKIEGCYTSGDIKGVNYTGGLVGEAENISVLKSYATGEIFGKQYCGGIVGRAKESTIEKSYALGNVTGTSYAGGLIGDLKNGGIVSESYSIGKVTGETSSFSIGGLIGCASLTAADANSKSMIIKNSFSIGDVSGSSSRIGGLVGDTGSYVQIDNCYSSGSVIGTGGGLVGSGTPKITNSYFDNQKCLYDTPESQARTTEQLMKQETFVSWDFDNIWNIIEDNSYPYIRSIESPFESPLESPKTIAYKNLTTNSVVIEWSDVSGATEYEVNYGNKSLITKDLSIEIDQLLPNREYKFKVRGKNKDVQGKWSEILTINTEALPLEKVEGLTCIKKLDSSVTLGWNAVEDSTGYEIIFNDIVLTSTTTSITIDNLKPDTTYTFQVRAVNNKYKGILSDPLTVITVTYNPQTAYAKEFFEKSEEQYWFIDAVEELLNKQGKSVNTIESKEDFVNIYAIGVANKKINGIIPKSIGELYNVEYIYFCKNNLQGGIPNELYGLSKLKNLDLSENELSGNISEQISRLNELEVLLLHRNQFEGTIPTGISSLKSLKNLDLAGNKLEGGIPSGIFSLTNLKFLSLSDNNLTGTLSSEVSNLTNLEVLILSNNLITGNVINIFGEKNNLKIVDLSNSHYEKDEIDEVFLGYMDEDKLTGFTVIIK